mmetsp:Transcript_5918/g.19902  ORF Transcript_5918/g.19902 Transcript_5918/m.19902 type:complete len:253 (-) Transcript_5918:44-802(-)
MQALRRLATCTLPRLARPRPLPRQLLPLRRALCTPRPSTGGTWVTWTSLGLTAVTAAGLLAFYQVESEKRLKQTSKKITSVGRPALGGPFTLVNAADGSTVTEAHFRGRYLLIYFGFTRCPDICPSELVKMGRVLRSLDPAVAERITPVFISVDPGRDTLQQLRHYAQDFHDSFVFLTGTPGQVAAAARAYRVYFSKADQHDDDDDDYLVDHSIVFYFSSPTSQFLDFFTQSATVSDCAKKITAYVQQKVES